MSICGEKKQKELDKILKKTKFSHRTKGLATYYSGGMTPKMEELFSGILKANIPILDVRPLTLILYDASRNGCPRIAGFHSAYGVRGWKENIMADTDFVCWVHSKTRRTTLERWREAMRLIDNQKFKIKRR